MKSLSCRLDTAGSTAPAMQVCAERGTITGVTCTCSEARDPKCQAQIQKRAIKRPLSMPRDAPSPCQAEVGRPTSLPGPCPAVVRAMTTRGLGWAPLSPPFPACQDWHSHPSRLSRRSLWPLCSLGGHNDAGAGQAPGVDALGGAPEHGCAGGDHGPGGGGHAADQVHCLPGTSHHRSPFW